MTGFIGMCAGCWLWLASDQPGPRPSMDSEPSRPSWTKLVAVNLLIFFVIFNLLYWSIPAVSTILRVVAHETEIRAPLPPNYDGIPWARRHYEERAIRGTVYRSFVEWRHAPMAGETITVEGPNLQRRTINENTTRDRTAYFFGARPCGETARTTPARSLHNSPA